MNIKKKEAKQRSKEQLLVMDHTFKKIRRLAQDTKKKDCPVIFNVKKIYSFPNFSIEKNTKYIRDKAAKQLKDQLFNNSSNLEYRLQYLIRLPMGGHENHNTGLAAGLIEPLDQRISDFLKKLIREGCRRVKEIELRALDFVKDNLFPGSPNPPIFRNRFYPERRKIRNLITYVKMEMRFSKIDQENVKQLLSRCSSSKVYFRQRFDTIFIIIILTFNQNYCIFYSILVN